MYRCCKCYVKLSDTGCSVYTVYLLVCVCVCVWPPVAVLNMLTAALLLWF